MPMIGEVGNVGYSPGRPSGIGCGRTRALGVLDRMLNKEENRDLLEKAFQKKFEHDPFWFFIHVVAPLIPKSAFNGEKGEGAAMPGMTNMTPDQLVLAMDQSVAPRAKAPPVRKRLDE